MLAESEWPKSGGINPYCLHAVLFQCNKSPEIKGARMKFVRENLDVRALTMTSIITNRSLSDIKAEWHTPGHNFYF